LLFMLISGHLLLIVVNVIWTDLAVLINTGFLDFVHRPEFYSYKIQRFGN
jgi:hypothetical protein